MTDFWELPKPPEIPALIAYIIERKAKVVNLLNIDLNLI